MLFLEQELHEKTLLSLSLATQAEKLAAQVTALQSEKEMLITKQLESNYQSNPQMLSLIKSERDQLLKKNAKAKERLLDLDQLRKDKVQLE